MNPLPLRLSSKRPVRLVLTFALGLLFAFGLLSVSGGDAHAASDTERFRFSSSLCISEKAQIYEWSRDGRLYGQSVTRPLRGNCSTPLSAPPGYVWSRVNVEKWDPYYGEYRYCTGAEWYSSSWTSKHVVYVGLGPRYYRTCGSGWYQTKSWGSVYAFGYWNNTPWVYSGEAYFR